MTGVGSSPSSRDREAWRKRWRAFVAPQWKRLERDVLSEREARVLSLRLGMLNDAGLTHSQIARRLHVSAGAVSGIEKRAIAKVTAALQEAR